MKRVYLDVQGKMEEVKMESLLNKFDAEGAQALSDEITEILERRNEAEFSTAVSVINTLNRLNSLNENDVVALLTNVKNCRASMLWKITFLLEVDIVNDEIWNEFVDTALTKSSEVEDCRGIHSLCNKVFRRMGGNALRHFQPHSEKILALRPKLQSCDIAIDFKDKAIESSPSASPDASVRVACVISTWPQKTDSTHMGVVYLLKELVTNGAEENEFHLVISGESENFSPYGRLTSLTEEVTQAQVDHWMSNGGKPEHLYSNIDMKNDAFTKNVRIIDAVNHVSSIKPDLIIYIGGPYESTFFRKLLFPYFATCVVPTSINGTPAPGFDGVIATSDEAADKFMKRFKGLTYQVAKPFMLFQNSDEYNGWFPDVESGSIVVATVLGGNRIQKCLSNLSESEINTIAKIFLNNGNLTWVLVGKTDIQEIAGLSEEFKYLVEKKRIVYIEYVTEIRSFLRKLDVFFVIPGMTGGGQGAQAAMFENVAVVCPFVCDVGGIVPEEGKFNSISECKDVFEKVQNAQFLTELKEACSTAVKSNSIEHVASEWQAAFKGMIEGAHTRLKIKNTSNQS